MIWHRNGVHTVICTLCNANYYKFSLNFDFLPHHTFLRISCEKNWLFSLQDPISYFPWKNPIFSFLFSTTPNFKNFRENNKFFCFVLQLPFSRIFCEIYLFSFFSSWITDYEVRVTWVWVWSQLQQVPFSWWKIASKC